MTAAKIKAPPPHAAYPSLARSLFGRALFLYVALSAVSLAAFFFITTEAELARLRNTADKTADLIMNTVAYPLWNFDDELVRRIASAFDSSQSFASLRVTYADDRVAASFGEDTLPGESRRRDVVYRDKLIGRVEIILSRSPIERVATERLLAFSALVALGIIVFFAAGRRVLGRFLQISLRELTVASAAFANGSFGSEPAPPVYEEFRPLVEAIGSLGIVIRGQIAELQDQAAAQEANIGKLAKALTEREALLKEVHHRVKNNLQILGAFVGEGKREAGTEEVKSVLSVMERRIQTMAAIYDLCVDVADLRRVPLAGILESVGRDSAMEAAPGVHVEFDLASGIAVPLEEALIAGILVSDLVAHIASAWPGPRSPMGSRPLRLSLTASGGKTDISIDCPWSEGIDRAVRSELLEVAARDIGFVLDEGESTSWIRIGLPRISAADGHERGDRP